MAFRGESDWTIGCVDSNNTYELDIYYKPYKSGYYQIQNTIILKSAKTLKELPINDALPNIPIDINSVEFLPQKSDSLSVNTDTFFEHLLEYKFDLYIYLSKTATTIFEIHQKYLNIVI